MRRNAGPGHASTGNNISSTQAVDAAAADPFFLSWGSSVNVNEDLRRTIRAEIEEIDASIMSIQQSIKNEERTAAQLTKDLSHSRSEMLNLRRGAADELDGASMNEQVQDRLTEQLKSEMLVGIVTPPSSPEADSQSGSPTSMDEDLNVGETDHSQDGDINCSRKSGKAVTLATYIAQSNAELHKLTIAIRKGKDDLQEAETRISSTNEEAIYLLKRIETDNLVGARAAAEKEAEARRREAETETQRKRSITEAIQRARKRCGDYAQQIADNTKIFKANKDANSSHESKLSLTLANVEKEVLNIESTEIANLDGTLGKLSGQLDHITRQFAEIEAIRKMIKTNDDDREQVQKENADLIMQEKELTKTSNQVKEALQATKAAFTDATKKEEAVEAERVYNDKAEEEEVKPAEAKRIELMKEKEKLAGVIAELHQKSVEIEEKNKAALEEKTNIRISVQAAIKEIKEELKAKQTERAGILQLCEENNAAAKKEIEDHETFKLKFQEAAAAELARIEDLKQQHEKMRKERIAARRVEAAKVRDALELKLEIIKQGAAIINQTEQTEIHLKEAPIKLNENGEENEESEVFFSAKEVEMPQECSQTDDLPKNRDTSKSQVQPTQTPIQPDKMDEEQNIEQAAQNTVQNPTPSCTPPTPEPVAPLEPSNIQQVVSDDMSPFPKVKGKNSHDQGHVVPEKTVPSSPKLVRQNSRTQEKLTSQEMAPPSPKLVRRNSRTRSKSTSDNVDPPSPKLLRRNSRTRGKSNQNEMPPSSPKATRRSKRNR